MGDLQNDEAIRSRRESVDTLLAGEILQAYVHAIYKLKKKCGHCVHKKHFQLNNTKSQESRVV